MKEVRKKETRSWLSGKCLGGLLTALMLFFGAPTFAQEIGIDNVSATAEEEFGEWDTDNDNQWNEDEFGTALNSAGVFGEWDTDNDDAFSEDELNEGIFNTYDEDDDGFYSEDEFNTWNTAWGGDYDYDAWDTNDDNMLDSDEFGVGVNDAGAFDEWDTDNDGVFSEDEITTGLYDTWDTNDDNYLGVDEFESYGYGLW